MISEEIPLRRRVAGAVYALVVNAFIWIAVPALFASALAVSLPDLPLSSLGFVFAFGGIITGLMVLGALTKGMAVSVPFISGAHLAAATYIWEALNGGVISVSVEGMPVTLTFTALMFLLVLPSLFNAIRVPVEYLLEESEAGTAARDLP